jgi:tellurite resistance protein TehA-like permease
MQTEIFGNAMTPGSSTRMGPLASIIISALNSLSLSDAQDWQDIRHSTFWWESYSNPSLFVCSILHTYGLKFYA